MDIDHEKKQYRSLLENCQLLNFPPNLLDHKRPVYRNSQTSLSRYKSEYSESTLVYLNRFFYDIKESLLNGISICSHENTTHHGYTFPVQEDILNFASTNNPECPTECEVNLIGPIANKSPENVDSWLQDFFATTKLKINRNEEYVSYIICAGKVGSGKTTFINYLMMNHRPVFDQFEIIPVVLYYKDWKLESDLNFSTRAEWSEYIDNVILLKIFRTLFNSREIRELVATDDFRNYFIHEQSMHLRIDQEEESNLTFFTDEELTEKASREYRIALDIVYNFSEIRFGKIKETIKLTILKYLINSGKTFFIIIDGLDQLSIGGINEGKYKFLFETLSSKALDSPNLNKDTSIRLLFLFTFRMCTYSTFNEKCQSEVYAPSKVYPIAPANLQNIMKNAVESIIISTSNSVYVQNKTDINRYMEEIVKFLVKEFDFKNCYELCAMFNNNYRELLNFIIELNKYACAKILQARAYDNLGSLLIQLIDLLRTNGLKRYELLEILILRDKSYFQNFYDFARGSRHSFDSIMHKNANRGFVDNVYNYTQNYYGSEVQPLLVNIRILQFLKKQGYSTEEEIERFVKLLGYSCDTSSILRHYSGSGYIKVRTKNKEILGTNSEPSPQYIYCITGLGSYIVSTLSTSSCYIEHILHSTLFPEIICDNIHALYQSNIPEWIEWSFVNLFIFYNYVLHLEASEERHNATVRSLLPNRELTAKIKHSILESLSRVTPQDARPPCDMSRVNIAIQNIIMNSNLKFSTSGIQ